MPTIVTQNSFSSGEVSPTLYGRADMAKYANGVELAKNFFVDYRGGLSNRTGTAHIGRTLTQSFAGNVRIQRFQVATVDNYILEFGDQYMRVIRDGAYVTQTPVAIANITQVNPAVVTSNAHGLVNGEVIYLANAQTPITNQIYVVTAATANTFQLLTEDGLSVSGVGIGAYVTVATWARLYKLATPYTDAQIPDLRFSQSTDIMTITHPLHEVRELKRIGHANWTLTVATFAAAISPPNVVTAAYAGPVPSNPINYAYAVTAIDNNGEESVISNLAEVTGEAARQFEVTWNDVSNVAFYAVYRSQAASTAVGVAGGTAMGFLGYARNTAFADFNITPDFSKQPPTNQNPFAANRILAINVVTRGAGYGTTNIIITDGTGTGAVAMPLIRGGELRSVAVISGGKNYTAPTITVNGAGAGATATAVLGPSTGTYPRISGYFQQRRVFASTDNNPATVWGSRPGQPNNMDTTIPSNSGDAFEFTLASAEVNTIRSMMPMPGGLVLFTSSAVWQLSGSGVNAPVLPTNAVANPQSYEGASDLVPIAVDYNILYTQISGTVVHELTYNAVAQNYTTIDLTAFSSHLFLRYDRADPITSWAFAKIPFKLMYAIQRSGRLLILTYMKEQEVAGWSQHTTRGNFTDVACIRRNSLDEIYVITQRLINGVWRRSIERFMPRLFPNGAEDAWMLDAGAELAMPTYNAYLTFGAASGTGVTVTASSSVFVVGDVGKIIRAGGGKCEITGFTSGTVVTVSFLRNMTQLVQETVTPTPDVIRPGDWTMTRPVTTLYGLAHLEGQTITVYADGGVIDGLVVVNGSVTLPRAASRVIAGLGYTALLRPLPQLTNPPSTGRLRKNVKVTMKVAATRGLELGHAMDTLVPVKETVTVVGGPVELYTGEVPLTLDPAYSTTGQLYVRAKDPVPATILSLSYESEISDA